jgi:hypothetical protein
MLLFMRCGNQNSPVKTPTAPKNIASAERKRDHHVFMVLLAIVREPRGSVQETGREPRRNLECIIVPITM